MEIESLTIPEHLEDKFKLLNYSAKKVLITLLEGHKFSAVELTETTRVPDVRSAIRYIRDIGIPISDFWERTDYSRQKIYFIHDASEGGRR